MQTPLRYSTNHRKRERRRKASQRLRAERKAAKYFGMHVDELRQHEYKAEMVACAKTIHKSRLTRAQWLSMFVLEGNHMPDTMLRLLTAAMNVGP